MQVSRIITFTIYIRIQQTTFSEIQLRRRCNGIRAILSRYIGIERGICRNNTFLDLIRITSGILVNRNSQDIGNLHRSIMPHEHLATVTATCQCSAIQHRQVTIRPLESSLQYIRYRTSVLEEINTTG